MKRTLRHVPTSKQAPQSQVIPGREPDMIRNYAGAFAFKADKWTRLNRFLTIGSEGGTYYASEKTVTIDNIQAVRECVAEDGIRVVNILVEISQTGRAPKNDQAILVLAYCLKYQTANPHDKTALAIRRAAGEAIDKVCRIGTHIFQLADAIQAFGGWGSLTRRVIADWYNNRSLDQCAFQAVKYQNREGWAHRDLMRLSGLHDSHGHRHEDATRAQLYDWIANRTVSTEPKETLEGVTGLPKIVEGFERIQKAGTFAVTTNSSKLIASLIREYRLPREVVPTTFLNEKVVWEALLEDMPMTALIRNLGKMSSIGLLDPMSEWTRRVCDQLTDTEKLHKARIHPINVLVALKTYSQGHGIKGSLTWTPNQQVINGLDDAFYGSFDNIEPINKRVLVAIDKSSSMLRAASATILTAQECAAVMAMVTVRKSSQYYVVAYDSEDTYWAGGRSHKSLVDIQIDPRQRLDDILKKLPHDGGGTDASLPIRWAVDNKIMFDAICLYSDGESWAGHTHASQALDDYRRKSGINTLFCTCDTIAGKTQLNDNLDARSMHVSGFDEQAPSLIQSFINNT